MEFRRTGIPIKMETKPISAGITIHTVSFLTEPTDIRSDGRFKTILIVMIPAKMISFKSLPGFRKFFFPVP